MTFDTDKFIQYIQINNAIWETGSNVYMDRNIKQNAWMSVGNGMYKNWNELTNAEKGVHSKLSLLIYSGVFDLILWKGGGTQFTRIIHYFKYNIGFIYMLMFLNTYLLVHFILASFTHCSC